MLLGTAASFVFYGIAAAPAPTRKQIGIITNTVIDQAGRVKYYIVENERAVKGLKCAKESYQHLHRLLQ